MKKAYIKPSIDFIDVEIQTELLAASIALSSETFNEDNQDDLTVLAREHEGFDVWD